MPAQQAPLALMGTPRSIGPAQQRLKDLDALPYVDSITPDIKSQVEALIEEECRRGHKRPAEYQAELPPMPQLRFEGHPILAAELDRVKRKEPMQLLDTSRYRLDKPGQSKQNDLHAWLRSVDNAHAQLEHQYNRIQNLELLLKYGDKSWRAQTMLDEAALKQLDNELQSTRKTTTELNQDRKLHQTAAGSELRQAEQEYFELVFKNLEVEGACDAVEREVDRLKAEVAARQQQQSQQQQQETGNSAQAAGNGHAASASEEAGQAAEPQTQEQQQGAQGQANGQQEALAGQGGQQAGQDVEMSAT